MKKILSLILGFFFIVLSTSSALAAGSLSVSPATGSTTVGQTLEVNVNLTTGGSSVMGVDAVITFNPSFLSVSKVDWGTLFGSQSSNPTIDSTVGRIILHPSVTSSAYATTKDGVIAKITFSGKAAGTSAVSFTCTPVTTQNDSNIWSGGNDIINCAANTGGSYTISESGATNPTSTPTPGGNSDNTVTPTITSELPETGVTEWTFALGFFGFLFLLGGAKILLLKKD